MPKKALLLIYTDDLTVNQAEDQLERLGFEVTLQNASTFGTLQESYDLVVQMGLGVPGAQGLDFLRRVRQVIGPRTPILLVSSHGSTAMLKQAHDAGASRFLYRAFSSETFWLAVRGLGLEVPVQNDKRPA